MRLTLTLLILCISFAFKSQTWCSPGSEWYYGWENISGPTNGYIHVQYTGDTLIGSQLCKKTTKTIYWYNQMFQNSGSGIFGTEYTYADSNKVYIYKYNQFYTMYDFSATPGSSWTVPAIKDYPGCQTQATVTVDSIGTMVINSQTMRYVCVTYSDTAQHWGWCAKICEKIGPITSFNYFNGHFTTSALNYLFPVKNDFCGMVFDEIAEGGNLRCYSDSSAFNYSTGVAPYCTYIITGINKHTDRENIQGFPNPSHGIVSFANAPAEFFSICLTDVSGRLVLNRKNVLLSEPLSVEGIENGIYYLEIVKDENLYSTLKLVISE